MSTEVQPRYDEIIDKVKPDFIKMAPAHISFDAERGYAIQLLQNNSYLMQVAQSNPISLAQAVKNVSAIGLSLNPAKKQAYLIPRSVKVGNDWINKVFLEPSYMGLCDVATQSGDIEWVQAKCVYANDTFEDNGPGEKPTHKYNPFDSFGKRGEFVGAYCVAKTKEGDYLTTTINAEQVYSIRERSEAYKKRQSGPWVTDFEEMAKKSVLRQGFKTWPKTGLSERLEQAVQLSNENEGFEPIESAPEVNQFTVEQKKYFDKLIEKSDALGMAVFMASIDHGVQAALHNSFEKGTITKYKTIVRELSSKGHNQLADIKTALIDAATAGDDLAVKELLSDMSQEVTDFILTRIDDESRQFVQFCQQESAA